MKGTWRDPNELGWRHQHLATYVEKELERNMLVRTAREAQERLESVIVPQKIAQEICHDIRTDLNTHLMLKQRMACLVCLARGNHLACNCSEISRRYVYHQY